MVSTVDMLLPRSYRSRMRSLAYILLVLGGFGTTEIQPLPEGTRVRASPADRPAVARLRNDVEHWQALSKQRGPRLLLFAETGNPEVDRTGPIVRVDGPDKWPDETLTSYLVVVDEQHRVRLLMQSPASASGDWSLELTHVFDEAGRTVAFRRSSRFFNSECVEVAAERSTELFDPTGRRLARDYRLEDGDEKPLSPKGCVFNYRHPYRIFADLKSALEAARLTPLVTAAGGKLAP